MLCFVYYFDWCKKRLCRSNWSHAFFVRSFGYALFIYWRKAMKFIKFFIIVVSLISFLFIFSACIKTTDTDIIKKNEIDTTIPPFNCIHNYQDHVCSICNAMLGSDGLEYTLNEDKRSYCVSGIGTCNETKIYIASVYNKMPVTLIKEKAFLNCDSLTEIEIPNQVVTIGDEAFRYCMDLSKITISEGVINIGKLAFGDCRKVEQLTIPNSVTKIGANCFENAVSLKKITIPSNISHISDNIFFNAARLEEVIINEGVTSIPTTSGTYWHYVDGVPTVWRLLEADDPIGNWGQLIPLG